MMDEKKLYQAILREYGEDAQIKMCIEECSELINALCKRFRGRGKDADVITEIADATIMCQQMAILFGEDEVKAEILRKQERMIERMTLHALSTEELKEKDEKRHMSLRRLEVTNIEWDTDGEDVNLPEEITFDYYGKADEVYRRLYGKFDSFGFCVKTYHLDVKVVDMSIEDYLTAGFVGTMLMSIQIPKVKERLEELFGEQMRVKAQKPESGVLGRCVFEGKRHTVEFSFTGGDATVLKVALRENP